jgi:hypothetical protein
VHSLFLIEPPFPLITTISVTMDQPLPALAEAEQAVLKDHVIEKLKKLDLFTGMRNSLFARADVS